MYINNTQVVNISNYPIFAYVNTKLSATDLDKKTHLKMQNWIEDTPNHFDEMTDNNKGWTQRRARFGATVGSGANAKWKTTLEAQQFTGILHHPLPDIN